MSAPEFDGLPNNEKMVYRTLENHHHFLHAAHTRSATTRSTIKAAAAAPTPASVSPTLSYCCDDDYYNTVGSVRTAHIVALTNIPRIPIRPEIWEDARCYAREAEANGNTQGALGSACWEHKAHGHDLVDGCLGK